MSDKHQFVIQKKSQKSVRKMTSDWILIHLRWWCETFLGNIPHQLSENCQLTDFSHIFATWRERKSFLWHISDCFLNDKLTVIWLLFNNWYISDWFANLFQQTSDTILHLAVFWQISDTFLTYFRLNFATDSFLTDFWQISDCFLKFKKPGYALIVLIIVHSLLMSC